LTYDFTAAQPTLRSQMQSESDENMADRKRRLTAPDSPEERDGPAQAGSSSSIASVVEFGRGAPGSSWSNALDLTEENERPLPPPPPPPVRRTSRRTNPLASNRRASDLVLPRWQSDADVSQCPVCKNYFTFWYRKHHCRKCGRVVCANCSPHRITIPRQFIVRPPEPSSAILDLTGDTSPSSPTTPMQLWGGEEVRVCNPCVPDPNFSPPPQQLQRSPDPIPPENWRFPTESAAPSLRHPPRRLRNSSGPLPPLPPLPLHPGHRPTLSDASTLSPDHTRRLPQGPFLTHRGTFPTHASIRDLYNPPSLSNSTYYPPRTSSAAITTSDSAPSHLSAPSSRSYHNRPMIDVEIPPSVHSPVPPRRQIAEEDECPVCGEELPPKGPNGETTDRERHVEDCIAGHLYTSTPPSRTVSAPPTEGAEAASLASASSTSAPSAAGSLPGPSAPPLRQRRMTGGRMLVYRATEKDCVTEDGSEAECVICFEEFETGDEMGRLECLCRFHRVCFSPFPLF
jgi:hypothetical protein